MNITVSRSHEHELEQAVSDLEARGFEVVKKGKEINNSRVREKNHRTHRMEQQSSVSVKYIAVMRGG